MDKDLMDYMTKLANDNGLDIEFGKFTSGSISVRVWPSGQAGKFTVLSLEEARVALIFLDKFGGLQWSQH